jgi:lysosomal Pro-X carboxypeptidase
MVMPLCGKGQPNDFFWNDCPFTIDGAYQSCDSTFGNIGYDREFLRPDWALTNYGREFRAVGNIIFRYLFEYLCYHPGVFSNLNTQVSYIYGHYQTMNGYVAIFSNGYLDPWSGGGYSLKPRTDGSLVSIIIEDGAHHYDLRAANPLDTPAVINARQLETMYRVRQKSR